MANRRKPLLTLLGVVCLTASAFAAAIGLMKAFIGTRHEADVESPIAFAIAACLLAIGSGALLALRRGPHK